MSKQFLALCACVAVSFASCSKREPVGAGSSAEQTPSAGSVAATPAVPEPPIDACTLLTGEEIQAAMGEAVQGTRPHRQEEGGLVISHCRFELPVATDSVMLQVVQRGSGEGARDPRQVWQETFARDLEKAVKERKKAPPERVSDLGDEAFWLGGPKRGALYVLKGNRHFRLGFGGEANQELKIEKARQMARAILERL